MIQSPKALSFLNVSLFLAACLLAANLSAQSPNPPILFGGSGTHEFTELPLDASGFTDIRSIILGAGYSDARVVYVSNTGNDATATSYTNQSFSDPLNPDSVNAYSTVAAAYSQLRHGFPDVLLLERGGVWNEALGEVSGWQKGGRSPLSRMIVAAYGSSGNRPTLQPASHILIIQGANGTPSSVNNLIFADMHMYQRTRDPLNPDFDSSKPSYRCVQHLQDGADILYENNFCSHSQIGLQGYPEPTRHTNIALRRNIIADSYGVEGRYHMQGLYVSNVDGVWIEGNTFIHNGWNEVIPENDTIFNHNVYVQFSNTDVTFIDNISAQASATGIQLRTGGLLRNNLFLDDAIAAYIAGAGGEMSYNVVLGGRDGSYGNRSWGLEEKSTGSIEVFRNVVAHKRSGVSLGPFAYQIKDFDIGDPQTGTPQFPNLNAGAKIGQFYENVAYGWASDGVRALVNDDAVTGVRVGIASMQFRNNRIDVSDNSNSSVFAREVGVNPAIWNFSGNDYIAAASTPFLLDNATDFAGWLAETGESGATLNSFTFSDSSRTIESYMTTLGKTATLESFLVEARLQSKWFWRTEITAPVINNYIRSGFDVAHPE